MIDIIYPIVNLNENPKISTEKDKRILGYMEIYIYSNDRLEFTPHCHIFFTNLNLEIEVTIETLKIIWVKPPNKLEKYINWNELSKQKKSFINWLKEKPKNIKYLIYNNNYEVLKNVWNNQNQENKVKDISIDELIKSQL